MLSDISRNVLTPSLDTVSKAGISGLWTAEKLKNIKTYKNKRPAVTTGVKSKTPVTKSVPTFVFHLIVDWPMLPKWIKNWCWVPKSWTKNQKTSALSYYMKTGFINPTQFRIEWKASLWFFEMTERRGETKYTKRSTVSVWHKAVH